MFKISQDILGGKLQGSESGAIAAQVTEKWKQQNPDLVGKVYDVGQGPRGVVPTGARPAVGRSSRRSRVPARPEP